MEDFDGAKVFVEHSSFNVGPEQDGYRLTLQGFKDGGAGETKHRTHRLLGQLPHINHKDH